MSAGIELAPLLLVAVVKAIQDLQAQQNDSTNDSVRQDILGNQHRTQSHLGHLDLGASLEEHPVIQTLASTEVLIVPLPTKNLDQAKITFKKAGYSLLEADDTFALELEGLEAIRIVHRPEGLVALLPKAALGTPSLTECHKKLDRAFGKPFLQIPAQNLMAERHFPTCFRDKTLLSQTVRSLGGEIFENADGQLEAKIDSVSLLFSPAGDGSYTLVIRGPQEMVAALGRLQVLDNDYRKSVQEHTRNLVLNNMEQHGANLCQEEVLEDGTILMTLELREE